MSIYSVYLKHNEKQFYKGNTMIKHRTTNDNSTVTVIKDDRKNDYDTATYGLRNSKGEYVGTLCIDSIGTMVLSGDKGYKLTETPD